MWLELSGSPFCICQIRERKRHDHHIALYKSCQASPSSGLSQSFARTVSLISLISSLFRKCFDFRNWTKSRTSSSKKSGISSISCSNCSFACIEVIAVGFISLYTEACELIRSTQSHLEISDWEAIDELQRLNLECNQSGIETIDQSAIRNYS